MPPQPSGFPAPASPRWRRAHGSATELTELSALYRRSVEWILGAELNENESTTALYRAASGLSEDDKAQVLKFAQFLAAAGPAPTGPYPADDEE
jgi:hypothetical protein